MVIGEILRIKGNALFTAHPDQLLHDAVKAMVDYDVGSLVVMSQGALAGMLTFREVLRALDGDIQRIDQVKVGDVMVHQPFSCSVEDRVEEVTNTMLKQKIRYVPVFKEHTLLGVISFHDVQKAALEETSFENQMLKSYIKNWGGAEG